MLKNLLYLAILTVFVIAVWVASNVYHNLATSTISDDTNIRIAPISAVFDLDTAKSILKRKTVPVNLEETAKSATSTPTVVAPQAPKPEINLSEQKNIATSSEQLTPSKP